MRNRGSTPADVAHTFRKGHRIMVHVQSTWFPLIDRNPQTFCDIRKAEPGDFRKSAHRVFRTAEHPSGVWLWIVPSKT